MSVRRNLRLLLIRAAASKGVPYALAAGLLLLGSSCSSSRQLSGVFGKPREAATTDPFVSQDKGKVTHAYTAMKESEETPVVPLSHEEAASPADELVKTSAPPVVPREFPAERESPAPTDADAPSRASAPGESPPTSSVPWVQPVAYEEATPPAGGTEPVVTAEAESTPEFSSEKTHDSANPVSGEGGPVEASIPSDPFTTTTEASDPSTDLSGTNAPVADQETQLVLAAAPPLPTSVPEEATPVLQSPPIPRPAPATGVNPPQPPAFVGDEYIRDGGDQGLPVHYNGSSRMGLDTEDTVAEYADHFGNRHVKPSTEVQVYAPRFAAVRSVSQPLSDLAIDRASGTHEGTPLAGLQSRAVLDEQVQRDALQGARTWTRASGLETNSANDELVKADRVNLHVKLLNAFEDFGHVRDGAFHKVDATVLAAAIEAAFAWSGDQRPKIYAHDQAGQAVTARAIAEDMTGVEDRRTPGDLQLVKVADRASAQPGDVVTFTIRFDNVGDRELLNVKVVDNLSPRLRFIDESLESSATGKVQIEETSGGSQVLTFEFADPLPGKSGAHVTFQCRVL